MKLQQENLLDQMTREHSHEIENNRLEAQRLRETEKQEQEGIVNKRRDAEEDAWNAIDHMTDKNKDVLAESIEKGLINKAELTKFMSDLAARNKERSTKATELQEKKNQLEITMIE